MRVSREELTQLGDGPLDDVDRRAQLAGPDPDPELRGIEPEAVDVCRDLDRLMSVEGKDPHAELELRGRSREVRERLQAGRGRLVVRPQRVVPEMLAAGGEVTSESCVETGGDAQPSADRRGRVHGPSL